MAAPPDGSKDSGDALHSHGGNASVAASAAATASLFPAYAAAVPQQAPAWLQNTSFAAATTYNKPAPTADDQEARCKLCSLACRSPIAMLFQPHDHPFSHMAVMLIMILAFKPASGTQSPSEISNGCSDPLTCC